MLAVAAAADNATKGIIQKNPIPPKKNKTAKEPPFDGSTALQ
ncbi:hypothetical protein T458_21330 [Brevibacillus panacihumi W25]|uniref:Uncharacterized protein n=1 Tax=Brevibacillus panacihumi W25 TaxID=1408254 RepID=V6MEV4_9BACL|nr:hypothetical protein T458_21330 [Brevibacillus panacihumi W25]